jgi:hypothetical protein
MLPNGSAKKASLRLMAGKPNVCDNHNAPFSKQYLWTEISQMVAVPGMMLVNPNLLRALQLHLSLPPQRHRWFLVLQ